jgi:DNA-binding NarL/FixJ family response regulator
MIQNDESKKETRRARLVIADDNDLVRAGLSSMLADAPDFLVVAEAANGRQALELCRHFQPDLVLLDVQMPEMDGLSAGRAIKAACPGTKVVMLTMHENPEYLLEAFRAGAAGYLLKDVTRRELLAAIRQVLRGNAILNGETAVRILQKLANEAAAPVSPASHPASLPTPLTARETEILRLVVQGKTNREIGRILYLSPGTIKIHVEHILHKLEVSDRTQAAVRAVELGLAKGENES